MHVAARVALMPLTAILALAPAARAEDTPPVDGSAARASVEAKGDAPIVAYTYQATGAVAGTYGAQAYGLGAGARGGVGLAGAKRGVVGGGMTLWGSPVDRLTLVADAPRDATGNFAPSAAAIVRLLGRPGDGFALGALGKFKVEGFGVGPQNEMESEVEGGLLLSYARAHWHFDANAVTGFGTGDDGEIDVEGRARVGRDVGIVRVGLDGQARYRAAGTTSLVGGRVGDFSAGPQVMVGDGHWYAAVTAGPSTTNVYSGIGWTGVATLGAAAF